MWGRFVLVVAFVHVCAPPAAADSKSPLADRHRERARAARARGDLTTALTELHAAHAIDPKRDLLIEIAQLYERRNDCPVALAYYDRVIAEDPSGADGAKALQASAACRARTNAPTASSPRVEPPDLLQPGALSAGTMASRSGWNSTLMKPGTIARSDTPTTLMQPGTLAHTGTPMVLPESSRRAWCLCNVDRAGGALVLSGIVTGMLGVVMYGRSRVDVHDAANAPNPDQRAELLDSADSHRISAWLLGGASVALIGGGILRIVRARSDDDTGVAVRPTQGGGVAAWTRRF